MAGGRRRKRVLHLGGEGRSQSKKQVPHERTPALPFIRQGEKVTSM
jgi:hypothetical protein